MSFSSVFKSLQDIFPQVDRRILKAVAIEHTKDVGAAVESILNEVLPSMCSPPDAAHGPTNDKDDKLSVCSPYTDHQDVDFVSSLQKQRQLSEQHDAIEEANAGPPESRFVANEYDDDSHHRREEPDANLTCLADELAGSSISNSQDSNYPDKLCVNNETEELGYPTQHQEQVHIGSHQGAHALSSSEMHDDGVFFECNDVANVTDHDLNESFHVANSSEIGNALARVDSSNVIVEDASGRHIAASNDGIKVEARGLLETVSEKIGHDTKLADCNHEDESFSTITVTQSDQTRKIEILEDSMNEARNNKKTLFSSMESVISMMREVEDLERAAEHAKDEAVRGGLDTFSKVEDIRKMLLHAKEANDMHAGEVYGEKAILATEARELQSRLLNLSVERDRSLAILDEMRQTLEARLVAAEKVRKAAEEDMLEKEGFAQKALAEQERNMEQVVQESKRLQREAEENSKLREFLMDRGQVVDVLQGEIAVICHDIKLLKENFDARVPLRKSLSSSQTSCILAASGSSGKSLVSNLVSEEFESSESPKLTSTTPVDSSSEKSTCEGQEGIKKLTDDGWDLPEINTYEGTAGREKLMDDDWDLFEDEADL